MKYLKQKKSKVFKNKKLCKALLISSSIAIGSVIANISDVYAAKYVIITSSQSSIAHPALKQIGLGFLKQRPIDNSNGDSLTPIGNPEQKAKEAFYQSTINESASDVSSYWTKQVFSGGLSQIQTIKAGYTGLDPNELIINYINKTPNTIGYVNYNAYMKASKDNKSNLKIVDAFNYPESSDDSDSTDQANIDTSTSSKSRFFSFGKNKKAQEITQQLEAKQQQQAELEKQEAIISQQKAQDQVAKKAKQEDQQAKVAQQKQKEQELASQVKVKDAQQKAKEAKQKALDEEKAAEEQAVLAQQQAQEAMAKAQERIKKVNAELKAQEQAKAKAQAIQRAKIQAAKARARAQAIAKSQQEAAQAQQAAEQAQARARAIEAKAKAETEAAEKKAKAAEEMLKNQENQQSNYNQGPVVTVVKKPSTQNDTYSTQTSPADNQGIDSQIEQATQNVNSAG